jgi:hypothetical protein
MYNDTKTKFDRVGFRQVLKGFQQAVLLVGITFIVIMLCGIAYIEKTTAEVEYTKLLADIRFENIKN